MGRELSLIPKLDSVADVVAKRLCIGCGACASLCPDQIRLFDFPGEGIRPVIQGDARALPERSLKVCPVVPQPTDKANQRNSVSILSSSEWGCVLEVWEGYAIDPEIRFQGSSGGALTAISAYCLETLGMHGVLHIVQSESAPIRNRTQMSRTREELISAAGSRYAPASVCDHLEWVEEAPGPCVVIGKPGEIAALRNAEELRPELKSKVGVALSFFCAETPSTLGTSELLRKMKVSPQAVKELKYRGRGWPGHFAPVLKNETEPLKKMSYRESWAFLQSFRPWSAHVWPDGTGELADISCGDPWYEEPDGENPGFSLVVVRTELGRRIIRGAIDAAYLHLTPAEPWKLEKSQAGLIRKKGAVWGRLLAMRLFGLPAPNLRAAGLFHCWMKLSLKEKLQSTVGSAWRIFQRRLYRPLKLDHSTAVSVD